MTVARRPAGERAPGRPRWFLFVALALSVFVADQVVKAWVVAGFEVGRSVEILGDAVRITFIHNTGALFGLFRDQALLFAAVSVGVVGLIVWYHAKAGHALVPSVALGLLLGGALGNLADRLRFGYVVDFVDAGIGPWRWYTFNVADAAISTAIGLLVVVSLVPSLAGSPHEVARGGEDPAREDDRGAGDARPTDG